MSTIISKTTIISAGVIGFLAYCVYFDRKRRRDPLFKQKLKQKREMAKKKYKEAVESSTQLPDLRDYEAVQKFFIQEVQLGEELLASGEIENGIEHLSNAVAVCGQPQQLLQVLQQTLPPQVFHLLLQRLPIVSQKLTKGVSVVGSGNGLERNEVMAEDDVE